MSVRSRVLLISGIIIIFVILGLLMTFSNFGIVHEERQTEVESGEEEIINKEQPEVLELTQDNVELEIGSKFDFKQYIKIATDKYGYSIKEKITTTSEIPTDRAGKYQVEYIMDIGEGKVLSKVLNVTIKNYSEDYEGQLVQ